MGCVSSKIMTKSTSFREEYFNRSMRKRTSAGVEEIIITKNSSDQLVALLCAADAVARKLKEGSHAQEANRIKNSEEAEGGGVETINTWEMLAGLEEDDNRRSTVASNEAVGPSRSFRTVEDFDAMVAANGAAGSSEGSINKNGSEKGSRRKAMAKELTALKVPGFEFVRSGSLREWLQQGGQVVSPGSYVTPKFGNFVSPGARKGEATAVFDPELIEQFEQAMEHLTKEEESILQEIVESLEGDNEEQGVSENSGQTSLISTEVVSLSGA